MTLSLLAALIVAALPVLGWSSDAESAVAAFVLALSGAVQAWQLGGADKFLPLLVGLGEALTAVLLAFRFEVPSNYLTAGMAVLTIISGLATRAQVSAKQPGGAHDVRVVNAPVVRALQHGSAESMRAQVEHELRDGDPSPSG